MQDKLINIDALSDVLGGIGRASVYRYIKTIPNFPQPVKIGASTRFRASDVESFIKGTASAGKEAKQ